MLEAEIPTAVGSPFCKKGSIIATFIYLICYLNLFVLRKSYLILIPDRASVDVAR